MGVRSAALVGRAAAPPRLERMRVRDLPEVLAIERASFPDPWTEANFRSELCLPEARARVARATPGGPVLGYVLWRLLPDDCDLMNIAVRPDWRRRGLGRLLLGAVLRSAARAGSRRLVLEVRAGNEPALALYRSLGFQPVGRRRGYYEDRADALLMARPVSRAAGP